MRFISVIRELILLLVLSVCDKSVFVYRLHLRLEYIKSEYSDTQQSMYSDTQQSIRRNKMKINDFAMTENEF